MTPQRLRAPDELNRNAKRARKHDPDDTGAKLLGQVAEAIGRTDLAGVDMLDVGCGVRFTQVIHNRDLAIGSYTGVDVEPKVIEWLQGNVSDPRFRYALWKVRNDMYHRTDEPMSRTSRLPIGGEFDLIGLFSVFTHMNPDDSDAMLHILRRHVRPDGRLVFTAIIADDLETFEDRVPGKPLLKATYSDRYMRELIAGAGWRVAAALPKNRRVMYVCAPA